jgi:aryl carrier-like protein
VRNAAIVDIGDALDSRRLAAFVETELPIPADGLATYLRDRVPYYMVPDTIRTIAAIPRLPNGKIDRLWLAAQAQRPTAPAPATERPRTAVEARIAAILEELLGHDRIGLDDNFFSLGGTSLLGMRYLARINDVCNVRLGAAALLRAPTVSAMAQLVADQSAGAPTVKTRELDVPPAAPIGQ